MMCDLRRLSDKFLRRLKDELGHITIYITQVAALKCIRYRIQRIDDEFIVCVVLILFTILIVVCLLHDVGLLVSIQHLMIRRKSSENRNQQAQQYYRYLLKVRYFEILFHKDSAKVMNKLRSQNSISGF